jgi:hypothetical protein
VHDRLLIRGRLRRLEPIPSESVRHRLRASCDQRRELPGKPVPRDAGGSTWQAATLNRCDRRQIRSASGMRRTTGLLRASYRSGRKRSSQTQVPPVQRERSRSAAHCSGRGGRAAKLQKVHPTQSLVSTFPSVRAGWWSQSCSDRDRAGFDPGNQPPRGAASQPLSQADRVDPRLLSFEVRDARAPPVTQPAVRCDSPEPARGLRRLRRRRWRYLVLLCAVRAVAAKPTLIVSAMTLVFTFTPALLVATAVKRHRPLVSVPRCAFHPVEPINFAFTVIVLALAPFCLYR